MSEPEVSVVVPTSREQHVLDRCLSSLAEQTVEPDEYEVIVVRLTDELRSPVHTTLSTGTTLKEVTITDPVPGRARNRGSTFAEGDILAFVDDDCVVAPDWIEQISRQFEDSGEELAAVGGAVKPLDGTENLVDRYLSYVGHLDGPITDEGEIINMASANLAVSRTQFNEVGGFDGRLTQVGAEDQNLISRIRKAGNVAFNDDILVRHDHAISFSGFIEKFYGYGYGVYQHYQFSNETPPADGVYRPRCASGVDIVRELPRLFENAVAELRDPGLLTVYLPVFIVLSLLKELSFQVGALQAHRTYTEHATSFVFD
jgi:glycosyltransferase involved in cell wall biosynthesis